MTIEIITDRDVWDSFIQQSPNGNIFHLWDFLKIVEQNSQYQVLTYGISRGPRLIAVIPLFYTKKYGLRFVFSPPPKTAIPHLGMVLDSSYATLTQNKKEHLLHLLTDDLISEVDTLAPNLVYIKNPPNLADFRNFIWNGYQLRPRYTYVLDLNPTLDTILNQFTRQRRKSIQKAERRGFEIRTREDLSELFMKMDNTYREQGLSVPLLYKDYLSDLYSAFPQLMELYSIEEGGQDVASILVTKFKDAKLWIGAGSGTGNSTELLIWNIIKDVKNEGFPSLEFTGANTRNLCKFKNQFNPSLKIYYELSQCDPLGKLSAYLYFTILKRAALHQ